MMIKIETKTLKPFSKNFTITFLNPVHIVPLNKVRFKLKGGHKIREFLPSEKMVVKNHSFIAEDLATCYSITFNRKPEYFPFF